jgi:hypothetical protein
MSQIIFPAIITSIVNSYVQPDAVFCFGCNTTSHELSGAFAPQTSNDYEHRHFSILIVANETRPNAVAEVTDLVFVKTNGLFSVTVLLHSQKWISEAPSKYRHFFAKVVASEPVYQTVDWKVPALWLEPAQRDFGAAAKAWEHRQVIIEATLQAENAIEHPAGEQVRAALLHQVVEQVCLGLVEVFMGYRPVHFGLGYLFDLCGNFTGLVDGVFPRQTEEEKELFKLLASNPALLRHRPQEIELADIEILQRRACVLYDRAAKEICAILELHTQLEH